MPTATPCVLHSELIAHPDGEFTMRAPTNQGICSIQADGSIQYRPNDGAHDGPFEKGPVVDGKLVLTHPAYPTGHYAVLVINR